MALERQSVGTHLNIVHAPASDQRSGPTPFNRVASALLPPAEADAVIAAESARLAGAKLVDVLPPDTDGDFAVTIADASGNNSTVMLDADATAALVGLNGLPAPITAGRR